MTYQYPAGVAVVAAWPLLVVTAAVTLPLFILLYFLVQGYIHALFYNRPITYYLTISPFQLMSHLNWQADPSPARQKDREQPHWVRVLNIEKQLNKLCCLHDSLMPLMELNVYESALYRWDNWIKTANKKIAECQSSIAGLAEQESRTGLNEPQINSKMLALSKVRDSLKETKLKLEGKNTQQQSITSDLESKGQLVRFLYNSVTNEQLRQKQIINPLAELQQQSAQGLSELKKYIQISLALFKNELVVSECSQSGKNSRRSLSTPDSSEQQVLDKFTSEMFHGLCKQVEYLRSQLKGGELKDFHARTMERISCDIVQIQQMLNLTTSDSRSERESWLPELDTIRQKVMLIGWQIKGLRKKYYYEITAQYQMVSDGYGVSVLQKMVEKDIKLLQNAYRQIKAKLENARRAPPN